MDPEAVRNWILATSAGIAALKEAISLLPDGEKRREAERAAARAEADFQEAEASLAQKLGFELCMRCWPPQIMRMNDDDVLVCRGCEKPWQMPSKNQGFRR